MMPFLNFVGTAIDRRGAVVQIFRHKGQCFLRTDRFEITPGHPRFRLEGLGVILASNQAKFVDLLQRIGEFYLEH